MAKLIKVDLPVVLVEWLDAWGNAERAVSLDTVKSLHEPELIHSLGWLLRDDELGVSIVTEYYDNETFRGQTFIPRAMIKSVTTYKLSKPRKPRHEKDSPDSSVGSDADSR